MIQYRVWQAGEEEDAQAIPAESQEEAAKKWAAWYDQHEEHDIANGARLAVIVEKLCDGQRPKWRFEMSGRWIPEYEATRTHSWSHIGGSWIAPLPGQRTREEWRSLSEECDKC